MSTVAAQDAEQLYPAGPVARLRPLFAPRGIAVIGASRDPAKLGAVMTRSLGGFPGAVAGINPRDADLSAGRYRSVADAVDRTGAPIDLAVLCVPADRSAAALAEAAAAGVRAALVCSGGYAEAGGAGVDHQRDLLAAAHACGVALLGPEHVGLHRAGPQADGLLRARGRRGSRRAGRRGRGQRRGQPRARLPADRGRASASSLAVGVGNAVDVTAADILS